MDSEAIRLLREMIHCMYGPWILRGTTADDVWICQFCGAPQGDDTHKDDCCYELAINLLNEVDGKVQT